MIKRVQRKFLRHAAFKLNIPYPPYDYTPIQQLFSLENLADRRHSAKSFLSNLLSAKIDSYIVFHLMSPAAVHDRPFHSIFHSPPLITVATLRSSVLCALQMLTLISPSKAEPCSFYYCILLYYIRIIYYYCNCYP